VKGLIDRKERLIIEILFLLLYIIIIIYNNKVFSLKEYKNADVKSGKPGKWESRLFKDTERWQLLKPDENVHRPVTCMWFFLKEQQARLVAL
jgi:hypothetical protein